MSLYRYSLDRQAGLTLYSTLHAAWLKTPCNMFRFLMQHEALMRCSMAIFPCSMAGSLMLHGNNNAFGKT